MRAAGLLLAWVLLRPAGAQQCHPSSSAAVLRFTDTHAEIRVPALHRVPSSLDPLYGLVRHYLDLIQQNPLPTGESPHGTVTLPPPPPPPLGALCSTWEWLVGSKLLCLITEGGSAHGGIGVHQVGRGSCP